MWALIGYIKAVLLYNCMENMQRFTPLYAILNSTKNLCFYKGGNLHVLVLYG